MTDYTGFVVFFFCSVLIYSASHADWSCLNINRCSYQVYIAAMAARTESSLSGCVMTDNGVSLVISPEFL